MLKTKSDRRDKLDTLLLCVQNELVYQKRIFK
jgi:hypothetical protein